MSVERFLLMDFRVDSDQMRLFRFIKKYKSALGQLPEKQSVRTTLFENLSSKVFLNMLSQMYLKLEDWMVWTEMKKDRDKADVLLVKVLNRRGGEQLADKKFALVEKRLKNGIGVDLKQSKLLADLYHHYYFSESQAKYKAEGTLLANVVKYHKYTIKEMSYLYLTEMSNWGRSVGYSYEDQVGQLLQAIELLDDSETSHICRLLTDLYLNDDQDALKVILQILESGVIRSGSDLEVFVVLYSINATRVLFNRNLLIDLSMLYRVFDYGMRLGVLLRLGKFGAVRYTDIIALLLRTGQVKESRVFADKWLSTVDESERQEAEALAHAYFLRNSENYGEILPLFRQVHFKSVRTEYIAYMLELMAWYKVEDFDTLHIMIHNFNRRLRRLRDDHKALYQGCRGFSEALKALMQSRFSNSKTVELDKYKVVFQKHWLQNEISSIRG